MPRTSSSRESLFPELTSKLSTDELVKRLKTCLKYLVECDVLKEVNISHLNKLSCSLLLSFLHNHRSRDVKALTAANIVEVFRLFHPEHPYADDDLKVVFSLFVSQLRGLDQPNGAPFKHAFQLLESLMKLQLFLLCLSPDLSDILADFFKIAFHVVSDIQTPKVKNYLLDMLVLLLHEGEIVSPDILDTMLTNIIDPVKSSNKPVYSFTVELIRKASSYIEPHLHKFFNNMLVVGNSSESELGLHLYTLIYELYAIDSSLLLSVLPQLEYKLTSTDINERKEVTEVLAKMFSPKGSKLAKENRPLWSCFLGRFSDAHTQIRILCTSFSKVLLVNHPHLAEDVACKLQERILDKDEKVRMGVVKVILETAQENIKLLPQELIDALINRLRDKSWNVRREAMIGLAKLYRKLLSGSSSSEVELKPSLVRMYSWIPTKLLHCYYMVSAEDRLCVERCMLGALVPVSYRSQDRMQRLVHVYARLDENATKAFDQLLVSRHQLRKHMMSVVTAIRSGQIPEDETKDHVLTSLVLPIARKLPEPVKAQAALKEFVKMLLEDEEMVDTLAKAVDCVIPCEHVQSAKVEMLNSVKSNDVVMEVMKNLLDFCGKVMVDNLCIGHLVEQVSRALFDCPLSDSQEQEAETFMVAKKAVRLLRVLAPVIPECFTSNEVFTGLVDILNHKDIEITKQALQVFISIGNQVDAKLASCLQPILTKLASSGHVQLAKLAVKCIHCVFQEPRPIFDKLCTTLVGHVDYEDPHFHTVLVSLSQLAKLQPEVFSPFHKTIVRDNLVKNLFVVDRDDTVYEFDVNCDSEWCEDDHVSYEAKAKVFAAKLLVNWLVGDNTLGEKAALPVIRMFISIILNNGDLLEKEHISPPDMSRLRLAAGCGLLKLACCPRYAELITAEHFQSLAYLVQDSCLEVRHLFAVKLSKKLLSIRLPPSYLSIFVLAGSEPQKTEKATFRKMVVSTVDKRRKAFSELLKAQEKHHAFLPEYAIPHAVYLISHHKDFRRTNIETLDNFKDCLWFFLEPIVVKGDNYSFVWKLLETMKSTVDAHNPDDPEINKNIYCTCDLAMGVLSKRMMHIKLGDFSGEVLLPAKLYSLKKGKIAKSSVKYLPPDYDCTPSKLPGIKTETDGSTPKKITPRKRAGRSKSPVLPVRRARKLRGFATSTPAVKPIKPFGARLGKKATPEKKTQTYSNSDENGLSDVEEAGVEASSLYVSPVRSSPRKGTVPRKQGVIRKVLQHKDKKEDDEIDPVCVGESGASPPAERKATRRSHRKKTAQEAVVSYVEPSSPDEDDADSEVEVNPSPKRRKTKDVAAKEKKVCADEPKNAATGIKRKTRHRR
ncbi:sister chromatid cohesion protein PDS5 homolog B-B-like [Halichondria panicea]|uniref:sister chromatid cohesion protein PDS5 homolog B-B-like n=1 Tax=Halichondria panicea TaxID=6063 RepID=UPI00312B8DF1